MARRPRRPSALPRALVALVAVAALLFLGGEAWVLARSGRGQVTQARWGLRDRSRLVPLFAREIRAGLDAVGVSADSVEEAELPRDGAPQRWRVKLRPGASLLQANYAVSHRIEELGGVVLDGREAAGPHGTTRLTLRLGLPRHALVELLLTAPPRPQDPGERPAPRLALVLYGFGEDVEQARGVFALPVPFAVAIVPGTKSSAALFRAAHERDREVVLHIPLEPVNYPQLDPGPGTLLVTTKPDRATGTVRRWLDQSGPVAGVANHMGSFATQDMTLMRAVCRELRRRHLPFIHVQPAAGAVCRSVAAEMGVVYDEPGAVLDFEARAATAKALDARWSGILKEARARGRLTVWVRATPLAREWLGRATTRKRLGDVDLAPLSAVMHRPAVL
jgi:polysaccharide deacetylase 2 family uncharacterized protein YibQ